MQKYGSIDALRGYAITGVMLVHCSQAVAPESRLLTTLMHAGSRGVQLFYIVSVITLCRSWHARAKQESHPTRNFFIRRIFRIAPLFFTAIVVHIALSGWGPRYWAPNGIRPWFLPVTALCMHGFHPETINGIVPGGWSVAVEVSFYALLPLLLRHVTGVLPAVLFAGVAYGLFAINHWGTPLLLNPLYPSTQRYLVESFTFFNFLGQLPVFALGVVLFHLMSTGHAVSSAAVIAVAAIPLHVVAESMGLGDLFPNYIVVSAVLLPCVALLVRHPHALLVNPLVVLLGKISFGLYLFHTAVIRGLQGASMPQAVVRSDSLSIGFALMVFCISAALAGILFLVIERPGIRLGSQFIEFLENRWRPRRPDSEADEGSGISAVPQSLSPPGHAPESR